MNLNDYITVIPDFPKKGISFKDITTLIGNGEAFAYSVDQFTAFAKEVGANVIIGPEARGFIFGSPVAYNLKCPFVLVRKPKKLPRDVISYSYDLEYGTDTLCMHVDSLKKGDKVLIIDDLVAVGGTINACAKLAEQLGAEVVGIACVIALKGLPGIVELPKKYNFKALLELSDEE